MDVRDLADEFDLYLQLRAHGVAEPNLPHLDEILLRQWRIAHFPDARDALLIRQQSRIRRLLHHLNQQAHLSREDLEDACQEAVFWTLEAIEKIDWYGLLERKTFTFWGFLKAFIKKHFSNFVRGVRRRKKHYRDQNPRSWAEATKDRHGTPAAESPSNIAESAERDTLLEQAVAHLPTSLQEIAIGVLRGEPLHHLAERQHVSYRTIKRRWKTVRTAFGLELHQLSVRGLPKELFPTVSP